MLAEKSILSGIIKYGIEGYNECRDIISSSSFEDNTNRVIFMCLASVLESQDKVDKSVLLVKATELKLFDQIKEKKLDELFNVDIQLGSIRNLAKKVKKLSIIREARSKLKEAYDDIQKLTGEESLDEIIRAIEKPVLDYSLSLSSDEETTTCLFDEVEDYYEHLSSGECDIVGISTSFKNVDEAMGGAMRKKTITLWGSRTGVGKSIMSGVVARYNAKQNIPVLYLDTEMSKEDQMSRSLAAISGVNINTIEQGKFIGNEEETAKIKNAVEEVKKYPIYYRSVAGKSFDEILSIMRRWLLQEVKDECLIIYDYFKLMDSSQLKEMQEYQAMGFQISQLHDFCVKYNVPVLAFVQLNRDGIEKDDASGISQSDRLAWLASNVAIFKEKTEEEIIEHGEDAGNIKFIPLKNRFGPGLKKGDYVLMYRNGSRSTMREIGLKSKIIKKKEEDEQDRAAEF